MARTSFVAAAAALVAVVAIVGAVQMRARRPTERQVARAEVVVGSLDDLFMDLEILPMDRQVPPPFTLAALDGRQVGLRDLTGRATLLYFFATW
ncbi:MAG: hypothetical protein HY294_11810 [Candidatus Rokubacteria bacterium]|nr:hypothetical protein [Candidatus Rokubacteria bacterium]MBI3826675.1 hypothetical protein [Candidatus Rokubacteria bacterium]